MTIWTVRADEAIVPQSVELVQHWKHGWIPLTPEAAAIKAKRKSGHLSSDGPGKSGKLTVADALAQDKLPPALRNKNLYKDEADHHKAIGDYLAKFPEGWKAPESKSAAPSGGKAVGSGDSLRAVSGTQREALERSNSHTPPEQRQKLTAEWKGIEAGPDPDPDEQEALEVWQFGEDEDLGDGTGQQMYQLLNHLKRGGSVDDLGVSPETEDALHAMDAALQRRLTRSKASRDVTLFRGIHHSGNVAPGDVLTDPGWAATSYNPSLAKSYSQAANGKLLVIHAPKGTPLIRVPDPDEHEVLFGPGTPMRVTRVDGNEIHVEVGQ